MKHTAKLSLIIALALCITVGGVYAAWTYINYEFIQADIYSRTASAQLAISSVETITQAKNGTIKVEGGRSALEIDQDSNRDGHYGILLWTGTQSVISYTPTELDPNGGGHEAPTHIDIKVTIEILGNNTYDEAPVLEFVTDQGLTIEGNKATFTLSAVGEGNNGIVRDLANYIKLHENFKLPTLADYNECRDILHDPNNPLHIKVTYEQATDPNVNQNP